MEKKERGKRKESIVSFVNPRGRRFPISLPPKDEFRRIEDEMLDLGLRTGLDTALSLIEDL